MPPSLIEETVMNSLRDQYVAQGFDFFERPPKHVVPPFLGGFQPDAIAVRGSEGVVFEIKARSGHPDHLKHIAERFEGQPRWQFRVIYYDVPEEAGPPDDSPVVRLAAHEPRIAQLLTEGHADLSLMLAWSVLEGIVRAKLGGGLRRPLPPLQIVEQLEHRGTIDADLAMKLRRAAAVRNGIAHGNFDLNPGTGLTEDVLEAARKIEGLRVRSN